MIPDDIVPLLAEFSMNPPAKPAHIAEVETHFDIRLPGEYRSFLTVANGGEGGVGRESYLVLDRVEKLPELNQSMQVAEYHPGLVVIGGDGGGEGFAFDTRTEPFRIVAFDLTSISPEDTRVVADNLWDFFRRLDKFTCGIDWDNPS